MINYLIQLSLSMYKSVSLFKSHHISLLSIYQSVWRSNFCLTTTTSQSVINSLKTAFACHGIPETLRTDNGPQFSSHKFTEFAKSTILLITIVVPTF